MATLNTCPVPHQGECGTLLRNHVIVETLETHGNDTYQNDDDVVMVWESSMTRVDGVWTSTSDWIAAPKTVCGLARWLGY